MRDGSRPPSGSTEEAPVAVLKDRNAKQESSSESQSTHYP